MSHHPGSSEQPPDAEPTTLRGFLRREWDEYWIGVRESEAERTKDWTPQDHANDQAT